MKYYFTFYWIAIAMLLQTPCEADVNTKTKNNREKKKSTPLQTSKTPNGKKNRAKKNAFINKDYITPIVAFCCGLVILFIFKKKRENNSNENEQTEEINENLPSIVKCYACEKKNIGFDKLGHDGYLKKTWIEKGVHQGKLKEIWNSIQSEDTTVEKDNKDMADTFVKSIIHHFSTNKAIDHTAINCDWGDASKIDAAALLSQKKTITSSVQKLNVSFEKLSKNQSALDLDEELLKNVITPIENLKSLFDAIKPAKPAQQNQRETTTDTSSQQQGQKDNASSQQQEQKDNAKKAALNAKKEPLKPFYCVGDDERAEYIKVAQYLEKIEVEFKKLEDEVNAIDKDKTRKENFDEAARNNYAEKKDFYEGMYQKLKFPLKPFELNNLNPYYDEDLHETIKMGHAQVKKAKEFNFEYYKTKNIKPMKDSYRAVCTGKEINRFKEAYQGVRDIKKKEIEKAYNTLYRDKRRGSKNNNGGDNNLETRIRDDAFILNLMKSHSESVKNLPKEVDTLLKEYENLKKQVGDSDGMGFIKLYKSELTKTPLMKEFQGRKVEDIEDKMVHYNMVKDTMCFFDKVVQQYNRNNEEDDNNKKDNNKLVEGIPLFTFKEDKETFDASLKAVNSLFVPNT